MTVPEAAQIIVTKPQFGNPAHIQAAEILGLARRIKELRTAGGWDAYDMPPIEAMSLEELRSTAKIHEDLAADGEEAHL